MLWEVKCVVIYPQDELSVYCWLLQAESMIEDIRTAFKNNLPSLDWMDEQTRIAAREKVFNTVSAI